MARDPEGGARAIDGRIVFQGPSTPTHGRAQGSIFSALAPLSSTAAAVTTERPGGWWFSQEVDMEIGGIGCRPDLVGWRRDRFPRLPVPDNRGLVVDVPDWICEVLSPTTAHLDTGRKREAYHRAGVAWYWIADPERRSLTVLHRADEGYVIVDVFSTGERAKAAPFDAVEVDLDALFPADEDEDGG
ncbi:MAG: Uma2 family endonuclease [Polyangiales bacterium]